MKDRHEWTDAIGGKWALETSEDQYVTTIEGFMNKNLGGQPMLHLPGMMGGQTIQDELSREILRLAAEVERLVGFVDSFKDCLERARAAEHEGFFTYDGCDADLIEAAREALSHADEKKPLPEPPEVCG